VDALSLIHPAFFVTAGLSGMGASKYDVSKSKSHKRLG
jgi:hypothetical protein